MRIVKGRYAGRYLSSPARRVRPTPEDVRDRAMDLVAEHLEGARMLDLFAGSGAVGLEALSRGAKTVDFVENGPEALHALKANVAALRVTKFTRIFKKDVIPWIRNLESGAYDMAFVDAPYGSRKLDRVVERWSVVPFADILLLEHDREHQIPVKGRTFDFEGPTRLTIVNV